MPVVDPTLVISIDRTSLSLSPLVFSGTPGVGELGIVDYAEPAMQPRTRYAASSDYEHGDEPRGWTWQQTILGWDFVTDATVSETESRALVAEVRTAIARLRYSVTVTVAGAPAETWLCNPGSLPAVPRKRPDLVDNNVVWPLSLPCNPVRTIA
jgi:hypothetical protein